MQNEKCKIAIKNLKLFSFKFWFYILPFAFYVLNFTGCATAGYVKPPIPPSMPGIYHRVEKGQTLWRISKGFDVELDEIVRVNHISDTSNIETGQLIFIPNRQKQLSLPISYSADDFIWPVRGKVITAFGQTFNNMLNKGINIRPYNNLNVFAARSGRVIFYSDNLGSFGKTLIIDHGEGFLSIYSGNSQVFIKAGDNVGKGTIIAKLGSGGQDKNVYLHFEIRKGHIPQNPLFYLP